MKVRCFGNDCSVALYYNQLDMLDDCDDNYIYNWITTHLASCSGPVIFNQPDQRTFIFQQSGILRECICDRALL